MDFYGFLYYIECKKNAESRYQYMQEKFKGIFTALLTPFDKDDKINEKALEQLVRHNL